MKRAREWADDQTIFSSPREQRIDGVRRVQADALRYAANLSGPLRSDHCMKLSDALERIAGGDEQPGDRENENTL